MSYCKKFYAKLFWEIKKKVSDAIELSFCQFWLKTNQKKNKRLEISKSQIRIIELNSAQKFIKKTSISKSNKKQNFVYMKKILKLQFKRNTIRLYLWRSITFMSREVCWPFSRYYFFYPNGEFKRNPDRNWNQNGFPIPLSLDRIYQEKPQNLCALKK
jgi:hypothetical protein